MGEWGASILRASLALLCFVAHNFKHQVDKEFVSCIFNCGWKKGMSPIKKKLECFYFYQKI